MMNITKVLVDTHKISKYFIAKEVGVSWNTVSFWYKKTFMPTIENNNKLKEILNEKKNNINKERI